ncbi:hypothetical protein [Arthrobacter sp. AET 35A]|uniref:hypothetical protein n=1 Tax=Arthrobacter sp. AET 35A TaxID=2292643 RepID=UPI001780C842|nr:hypothetical protein [Arthrobacter sp. AET 35A]MBE0011105.1 hypothetical protein [Arthrobacter sp. AET 35A]
MNESSRLLPEDAFPDDLSDLEKSEVELLNSRVHREMDAEIFEEDGPQPATQDRLEALNEELDRRDGTGAQAEPAASKIRENTA